MRCARRPSRAVPSLLVLLLTVVLVAPGGGSLAPARASGYTPAIEPLPPYFAQSAVTSPYSITVNGVELATDATGYNHWGEEAPLFTARTGLLVEADFVEVRVESRPVASPTAGSYTEFSVGLELLVSSEVGSVELAAAAGGQPGLNQYYSGSTCDGDAVDVADLGAPASNRLASIVGPALGGGVDGSAPYVFTCILEMRPSGAPAINGVYVEIGDVASFRHRSTDYIQNQWNAAEPDARVAAISTARGFARCTLVGDKTDEDLETALSSGDSFAWGDFVACPDGRIDIGDADSEVYSLLVFARDWRFAADRDAWLSEDQTVPQEERPSTFNSTLRVPLCADPPVAPCLVSIDTGWGLNLRDDSVMFEDDPEFPLELPRAALTLVRTAAHPVAGYGTVELDGADDEVSFTVRLPIPVEGGVRDIDWFSLTQPFLNSFAQILDYSYDVEIVDDDNDHLILSLEVAPRERSISLEASDFRSDCFVNLVDGLAVADPGCDLPDGFKRISGLSMFPRAWSSATGPDSAQRPTKKVRGWRVDQFASTCVEGGMGRDGCVAADGSPWEDGDGTKYLAVNWFGDGSEKTAIPLGTTLVTIETEAAHGYSAGDTVTFGGVVDTILDGGSFNIFAASSAHGLFSFVVTDVTEGVGDATDLKALTGEDPQGTPNSSCASDGTADFPSWLCLPDAPSFKTKPSRLILTLSDPHGVTVDQVAEVAATLLGDKFDGVYTDAIAISETALAIDGSWMATDAYTQDRDAVLVVGPNPASRVIITETSLTVEVLGLVGDDLGLAGGFVATNAQTFEFGEDIFAGAAFDFAVAGPSRRADGSLRSGDQADGFFQAFVPSAFLDENFGLTVAGAVGGLAVDRRGEGQVGAVQFEATPFDDGPPGVLIRSDGFSYSAPYFAVERRAVPAPAQASPTESGPVLVGGVVPSAAPGQRTAVLGGRAIVPDVPVVESDRMELVAGGSTIDLGGSGGSGGLAVRQEGGQQVVDLLQGSAFPLTGEGFQPGSVVEVWLFSEPQLLALARVDDTGRLAGEVPLDGWSSGGPIPPGRHTLQVGGVNADGQVVAFNVGVEVVTSLAPSPRRVTAGAAGASSGGTSSPDGSTAGPVGSDAPTAGGSTPEAPAAGATTEPGTSGAEAPSDEVAVVTAAEPSDGGGGAMRSLGLLAGVLAAGLLAYGIVASRRRRASS